LTRKFLETNTDDLMFEAYDHGMPVNEVAIEVKHCNEVAVWYDDDLRLRLAAQELLSALERQTDAAQAVIDNWGALHESALSVQHLGRSMNGLRAVCPLHP
jgi:hypothetical protein